VGIAVLISRTDGSLSFSAIRTAASDPVASAPLAVGLVLVLAALAFKAGAFPFHSWMPDALETAPPVASAVLASAGKVGPIAAAVWLASSAAGATGDRMLGVVALISVGSIVFGNLAALRQTSLARMLAYSAIAQVGYALAGLPMAQGRQATLLFVALYAVTSVTSFIFIVALRELEPGWDGSISGLAGLSRRHPMLAASLVPIMLSLTGIPLTAGFWGKFFVFGIAATQGYLWLAVVAVLGSVVSFGYYGGVLRAAFLEETVERPLGSEEGLPIKGSAAVSTMALAVFIVVIGVVPLLTGLGLFAR
jgi:NADH-quinone oxidoreductase subunit N